MPSGWLNNILHYKVAPPENTWANITNELDKENQNDVEIFKSKMLIHEEAPPAAVLDKIFHQLDGDISPFIPAYVERLKNHSENPPADTWDNIITQLNTGEDKIIPLQPERKNTKIVFLKIAAAAAIISIVIITILTVVKQNPTSSVPIASAIPQTVPKQTPPANNIANTQINNIAKVTDVIAPSKTNNLKQLSHINYTSTYVKGNAVAELAQDPALYYKEKLQNSNGKTPMDIALLNTPNTYISITGADGQSVKVSSKFSNLLGYLNQGTPDNRENIDVIIEESAKWRKIFSAWRDKMTNNTVAPSFTNFMDIIELSNVVEGKDN
jgi:hypothetical protein